VIAVSGDNVFPLIFTYLQNVKEAANYDKAHKMK